MSVESVKKPAIQAAMHTCLVSIYVIIPHNQDCVICQDNLQSVTCFSSTACQHTDADDKYITGMSIALSMFELVLKNSLVHTLTEQQ